MKKVWSSNKEMKVPQLLIIYLFCAFPILAACIILIACGIASPMYNGFGVDSSGVVYVGKEKKIEKYCDGEMIGEIDPQTSRAYAFTLQEDDTILLSTASYVYKMDLSGNVLDEWEDVGTKTYNELQWKRTFISRDNKKYTMKSWIGRTVICSEEGVIYKMPMLDYAVKIAFFLVLLSVAIVIPIIIVKWRKIYSVSA